MPPPSCSVTRTLPHTPPLPLFFITTTTAAGPTTTIPTRRCISINRDGSRSVGSVSPRHHPCGAAISGHSQRVGQRRNTLRHGHAGCSTEGGHHHRAGGCIPNSRGGGGGGGSDDDGGIDSPPSCDAHARTYTRGDPQQHGLRFKQEGRTAACVRGSPRRCPSPSPAPRLPRLLASLPILLMSMFMVVLAPFGAGDPSAVAIQWTRPHAAAAATAADWCSRQDQGLRGHASVPMRPSAAAAAAVSGSTLPLGFIDASRYYNGGQLSLLGATFRPGTTHTPLHEDGEDTVRKDTNVAAAARSLIAPLCASPSNPPPDGWQVIGQGGSGTAYRVKLSGELQGAPRGTTISEVVVKVAPNPAASASLYNECRMLRLLESRGADMRGFKRCVAACGDGGGDGGGGGAVVRTTTTTTTTTTATTTKATATSQRPHHHRDDEEQQQSGATTTRAMIVMHPYFEGDQVDRVGDHDGTTRVMHLLVEMLGRGNVALSDVQVLRADDGNMQLIDLTEAHEVRGEAEARAVVAEFVSLLQPDQTTHTAAAKALLHEVRALPALSDPVARALSEPPLSYAPPELLRELEGEVRGRHMH